MKQADTDLDETVRAAADEPSDRRGRILDGARSAFMRFGFERSSIADIAAGAGVSRTAVYHYFPGKEDVLQAVAAELHAKTLSSAREVLDSSDSLKTALTGLLQVKFGPALAVITASPHGRELIDAGNRLTGPATRAADEEFLALVVEALVSYGRDVEAEAVADTFVAAGRGLMGSSDRHVGKIEFDARVARLTEWVTH